MSEAKETKAVLIDPTKPNYHCGIHNFRTSIQAEWDKHFSDFPHQHKGAGLCKDCGKPVTYDKKEHIGFNPNNGVRLVPVYCDACLAKNVQDAKDRGLVK